MNTINKIPTWLSLIIIVGCILISDRMAFDDEKQQEIAGAKK